MPDKNPRKSSREDSAVLCLAICDDVGRMEAQQ